MRTILNFTLASLLFFEILSPFLLGYLNTNKTKAHPAAHSENVTTNTDKVVTSGKTKWKNMDMYEENYADSRSLTIKE